MNENDYIDLDEFQRRQWAESQISPNGMDSTAAPSPEAPLPLHRPLPEPEPFPVNGLGVLREAAEAIQDRTQAPMAIAAQAVLAVASLVVQGHANVILPTGQIRPTSCYFLTVAASGERKTSCDDLALKPIRDHLDSIRLQYEVELADYNTRVDLWKIGHDQALKESKGDPASAEADLHALGAKPIAPSEPRLICGEPTIEGLFKLLQHGFGFAGIFSSEGGSFVGGYGLNKDNKLKTAAYLSALWDGTPIDRTRAGEGLIVLHGRRTAAHLMVQPCVAEILLSDPELLSQGLLSRILVSAPAAAAGTRLWREPSPTSELALSDYGSRIGALLLRPRAHAEGKPAELMPRSLPMSPQARQLWIAYYDTIERAMGTNGPLAPIAGFAGKLPEHAARLAGVLTILANAEAVEITGGDMAAGITLAQHYQAEALRLFEAGFVDPDLLLAEKVLAFVRQRGGIVSLRCVYTLGPNAARDRATALRILNVLEKHGWLYRIPGGADIDGHHSRDAWRLRG